MSLESNHTARTRGVGLAASLWRKGAVTGVLAIAALTAMSDSALLWRAALGPGQLAAAQKPPAGKSAEGEQKPKAETEQKTRGVAPDEQADLQTLAEMEKNLPSTAEFLEEPPFDWVVLQSDKVIVVETVEPRPNTLEKMKETIKEHAKFLSRPVRTDADKEALEAARVKQAKLSYLPMQLTAGEASERGFKLHMRHIKQIIYYEDLMLRRVDAELNEHKPAEAFELLAALIRRDPAWPGLSQREERLLSMEATAKLQKQEPEAALIYLEDLHNHNPNYTGLSTQLGTAASQLISSAAAADDYRRARHFLERLRKCAPDHPVAADWSQRLQTAAAAALEQALKSEQAGRWDEAVDDVQTAARIWPQLATLPEAHRRISNRFQRLDVGVLQLADQKPGKLIPSAADLRAKQLGPPAFFEPYRLDGRLMRYRTRVFQEWEPTDLGWSILFRVKPRLAPWDSRSPLTAGQVVSTLARRMNPQDPQFDERFANLVSSVTLLSPFELTVDFARVPLRPEVLFNFPLGSAGASVEVASAANDVVIDSAAPPLPAATVLEPFALKSRTDDQLIYRRTIPEPLEEQQPHIAEIRERKYPSYEKAVQGLLRGEVSLLPHIPLWDVAQYRKFKNLYVHQYALPVTHVVQFHPRNKALANRTLRRAMIFALDRQQILDSAILRGTPSAANPSPEKLSKGTLAASVVSGPMPTTTYGYNKFIEPHKHDPTLSMTMLVAAKRELKEDIPAFRLHCPSDPIMTAAAQQLIQQWDRVGLKVTLAGSTDDLTVDRLDAPPTWDLVYRTVSMAAPLFELLPFLTLDPGARIESLRNFPPWLRQELVALEQAGDFPKAERIMHNLHRQLWAEVTLIPLWEVPDYLVVRNTVQNNPARPVFSYQGIEGWRVQPWYPKETP